MWVYLSVYHISISMHVILTLQKRFEKITTKLEWGKNVKV